MGYSSIKVEDLVNQAVNHTWSIPEFQRGFVWKAAQVRDLAESLYRGFPVGSLLLWDSSNNVATRGPKDAQIPTTWIVDGQQRTTALCLLMGRKPFWWEAPRWDDQLQRYDIRFDAFALPEEGARFLILNAALKKAKSGRYLKLREVLNAKDEELENLAHDLAAEAFNDGRSEMGYFRELQNLRSKIRGGELVAVTVQNELEDVVEIFGRLNSKGTRVTEADIYLGVVASRPGNAGWVRDHFLRFVADELAPAGFDVGPNTVFRTLTAVGVRKVRFKTIEPSFWENSSIVASWSNTTAAWKRVVKNLGEKGISSLDVIPSNNVLVPLVALAHKFPSAPFDAFFYWFIQATVYGRYSAASDTRLEEDLRNIDAAPDYQSAVERLLQPLKQHLEGWKATDFLEDYSDYGYLRLMVIGLIACDFGRCVCFCGESTT